MCKEGKHQRSAAEGDRNGGVGAVHTGGACAIRPVRSRLPGRTISKIWPQVVLLARHLALKKLVVDIFFIFLRN